MEQQKVTLQTIDGSTQEVEIAALVKSIRVPIWGGDDRYFDLLDHYSEQYLMPLYRERKPVASE